MTINKQTVANSYESNVIKQKENEALERATTSLGKEEGTALFNQAQAETIANSIIANKDYLYKSGIDKYNKEMDELANKGLKLSDEYRTKKQAIENNGDLAASGKAKQLEELYKVYNDQTKQVIEQQVKLRMDHNKTRDKVASETLELVEKKANINDFTDKEMQYILFMVEKADNNMLLNVLEEHKFNPFLINMINARDSKLSKHTEEGKLNTERLHVVHPLAYIREHKGMITNNELYTDIGTRTLQELIPLEGIPSLDKWANVTDKKAVW